METLLSVTHAQLKQAHIKYKGMIDDCTTQLELERLTPMLNNFNVQARRLGERQRARDMLSYRSHISTQIFTNQFEKLAERMDENG